LRESRQFEDVSLLDRIRIVLVEPTHPGNIGGVARAMKNMGLERLFLVAPRQFPSEEATARASGADDVLEQATVVPRLNDALVGCHPVVGTTARHRSIEWPTMAPKAMAEILVSGASETDIAIVFGRESGGLTNQELDRCHWRVEIPANTEYPSLNLACAVQIIAYEVKLAADASTGVEKNEESGADTPPVGQHSMEAFYTHLEQVMIETGFLNPSQPRKLMRRLRRLFNRAAPTETEMNILRGILTAVQEQVRRYTKS